MFLGKKIIISTMIISIMMSVVSLPLSVLATSEDEKKDCQTENFLGQPQYAVANGGEYYKMPVLDGKAALTIRKKVVDGKNRYCAIFVNHTDPAEKLYMTIKLGTREQGSTSNPVRWSKKATHQDKGWFSVKTNGVAMTPSSGRCVAVKVTATLGGDNPVGKKKVTYNLCNP